MDKLLALCHEPPKISINLTLKFSIHNYYGLNVNYKIVSINIISHFVLVCDYATTYGHFALSRIMLEY